MVLQSGYSSVTTSRLSQAHPSAIPHLPLSILHFVSCIRVDCLHPALVPALPRLWRRGTQLQGCWQQWSNAAQAIARAKDNQKSVVGASRTGEGKGAGVVLIRMLDGGGGGGSGGGGPPRPPPGPPTGPPSGPPPGPRSHAP